MYFQTCSSTKFKITLTRLQKVSYDIKTVDFSIRGDPKSIIEKQNNDRVKDNFFDVVVETMRNSEVNYEDGKLFGGKRVEIDVHVKYSINDGEYIKNNKEEKEGVLEEFVVDILNIVLIDENEIDSIELNQWIGDGDIGMNIVIREV